MQDILDEVEAAGASMVALSPQLAEFSAKIVDSQDLGFDILSDPGNAYAAQLGLRFDLPDSVTEIYQSFGIDLPGNNGDDSWTLPMPGRIVVRSDGIVHTVNADPDYTERPDPAETLAALKALAS